MSDIDERLEEEILHAFRKSFDSQQAGINANFLMDIQREIERLRADLAAALAAAATEKTLREHETKRANDNYASLTKHWLNESKLRELLTEIVEYNGGAGHALADEYVVARIKEEIRGE